VPERSWDGEDEGSPGRGGREKPGFQRRERPGIPTAQAQGTGAQVSVRRTRQDRIADDGAQRGWTDVAPCWVKAPPPWPFLG